MTSETNLKNEIPDIINPKPGVFFTVSGDSGILLDLIKDDYIVLGLQSTRIWELLSQGLRGDSLVERLGQEANLGQESARRLVEKQLEIWEDSGLVSVRSPSHSPQRLPKSKAIERAALDISEKEISATPLSASCLALMSEAMVETKLMLKHSQLPVVLRWIQFQPGRFSNFSQEKTRKRALRMLRAFRVVRSLMATKRDDCLPRSLSLALALRRFGIENDICFGVRGAPFGAHCWIESGGHILNDEVKYVHEYSVIARF